MTPTPWWQRKEQYCDPAIAPVYLKNFSGPYGIATVPLFADGRTGPGWGLQGKKQPDGTRAPGFMELYPKHHFSFKKARWQYEQHKRPFAFVMRSLTMLVVDIDGKNGGFESASKLKLPPTLAEVSRSNNGYHLFYLVDEERTWTDTGYAAFEDSIGLYPGVDIRDTGCVFHQPGQLWNQMLPATVPEFLIQKLNSKKEQRERAAATVLNLKELDDVEKLVAEHTLIEDLKKPMLTGSRNNTLFAIGSKMRAAGIDNYDALVFDRALEVGLDADEANKILDNIVSYGD